MPWQTAVGATESTTVTLLLQLLLLPFTSVTVRVTVLLPTSAQANVVSELLRVLMPQASLLPLSMSFAVIVADPLAFS